MYIDKTERGREEEEGREIEREKAKFSLVVGRSGGGGGGNEAELYK